MQTTVKLSVVTATLNAVQHLPRLADSLRQQTDKTFEWVVMDGGSQDGTRELLEGISDLNLVFRSEPDFGIYDALNKAIRQASGEHYLVVGADDTLEPGAVANYKALLEQTGCDILTAAVYIEGRGLVTQPRGPAWLTGQMAYVTAHSVGSVYRKCLHERKEIGFYASRYPIAADQLFIKRAMRAGARVARGDFVAGSFGNQGTSSTNPAGALTEFFRVQLETESKGLQVFLFLLRLIKNFPKLIR